MLRTLIAIALAVLIVIPSFATNGDHENVEFAGSLYNYWDTTYDVVVEGDYAYVATGVSGFQVVNISDLEDMYVTGCCEIEWGEKTYNIALFGNYAYVVDKYQGFWVIDIQDPSNPFVVHYRNVSYNPLAARVSEGYLYIINNRGLYIYNLSDPENPSYIGNVVTTGDAVNLEIAGNYAYVADESSLQIIDISNPEDSQIIGSYTTDGVSENLIYDVSVSESYAYVINGACGLRILDISDPTNPNEIGSYSNISSVTDIVVSGDYLYATFGWDGVGVIDVSDPINPNFVGGYDTPGITTELFVTDDYIYVTDGGRGVLSIMGGLRVLNSSDPTSLFEVGSINTKGSIQTISLDDNYAYLACELDGLHIADVSDPANPYEVSVCEIDGRVVGVAISGNFACLADMYNGLWVIDISDPEIPFIVSAVQLTESSCVTVSGEFAYVGCDPSWGGDGLHIINISDPTNPVDIGTWINYDDKIHEIEIIDNYAFLASSRIPVIDILVPIIPYQAYTIAGTGADAIDISGDFLYTPEYIYLIERLDHPVMVGQFDAGDRTNDVKVDGTNVFVVDRFDGLRIFDASDPLNPVEAGFYDTHGQAFNVEIADDYAFVGDYYSLRILDYSQATSDINNSQTIETPTKFSINSAYPNPFNPLMNVSIALPETGNLKVTIHNIMGQEVATLASGQHSAGIHNFVFNGSDLPSGTYFIHASFPRESTQVMKVSLVK